MVATPKTIAHHLLLRYLLAIGTSALVIGAANIESLHKSTYGVIVDCGSSGTRAHIFEWDSSLNYPELLNDIEPMRDEHRQPATMNIKPGLSSLEENPMDASEYMRPILEFILSEIPKNGQPSTGIYILGTAGMRLLDDDTQLKIMNDIANDIKDNYNFAKVKVAVIPGTYEGLYQWITVNSKARRFIDSKVDPIKTETYGIIEMGGASLQVSFRVNPNTWPQIEQSLGKRSMAWKVFKNHVVEPRISRQDKHHNYHIFSVSFLGFGSNSVREAYLDLLIRSRLIHRFADRKQRRRLLQLAMAKSHNTKYILDLEDPCLPIGAQQVVEKPLMLLDEMSDKTIGFNLNDEEPSFKVKLSGTGQYFKCRMLLKAMMIRAKEEKLNCKHEDTCGMTLLGTKFVPFESIDFLGLSDFYYTASEMGDLSGEYHREKIIGKTKMICRSNYDDLIAEYPKANEHDSNRVLLECFKLVWIDLFLTEGLRMSPDTRNFETIKQIKGDPLDWTLGAILDNSLAIERAADASQNG